MTRELYSTMWVTVRSGACGRGPQGDTGIVPTERSQPRIAQLTAGLLERIETHYGPLGGMDRRLSPATIGKGTDTRIAGSDVSQESTQRISA